VAIKIFVSSSSQDRPSDCLTQDIQALLVIDVHALVHEDKVGA